MNIAVIVRKMAFFYGSAIGIDPGNNQLIDENLLQAVNPYDESALNMALGIKQTHAEVRVLVATPQSDDSDGLLDHALSLGADEGVIIDVGPANMLSPFARAKRWARGLEKLEWQLLLLGIRKIDMNEDEMGVYLGAFLNLPVVSGIKQCSLESASDRHVRATRKLEKGHTQTVTCPIPAVMTVEISGKSRYPTLRGLATKKKKTVLHLSFDESLQQASHPVSVDALRPPKVRPKKGLVEIDKNLSVADKLGQLFSGGVTEKKNTDDTLKGPPDQVAEKLLVYMQDKGFL